MSDGSLKASTPVSREGKSIKMHHEQYWNTGHHLLPKPLRYFKHLPFVKNPPCTGVLSNPDEKHPDLPARLFPSIVNAFFLNWVQKAQNILSRLSLFLVDPIQDHFVSSAITAISLNKKATWDTMLFSWGNLLSFRFKTKGSTFSYVIVNCELVGFTAPDHPHRMPLIVIEFLSRIQCLWSLAWEWRSWKVNDILNRSLSIKPLLSISWGEKPCDLFFICTILPDRCTDYNSTILVIFVV